MLAQFVFPSKAGLFRIVRHGHRWRSLLDARETGRHPSAPVALETLCREWPRARLPTRLDEWRYLPELALAHSRLPRHPVLRWTSTG